MLNAYYTLAPLIFLFKVIQAWVSRWVQLTFALHHPRLFCLHLFSSGFKMTFGVC